MKQTPFTKYHIEAGARIVEFAGYSMPIEFKGINHEHRVIRERVGVFDVSHMGEIWVKGPKALEFLQRVTTNDVSVLEIGQIQYTLFTNEKGGVIDDVLLYKFDDQTYMFCTNASNTDKDWKHLLVHGEKMGLRIGEELYNASSEIAQLAIQGPRAMELVQRLTPTPITNLKYYTFIKADVAGVKDVIVSATGYTGSGGCELYFANEDAEQIWSALWRSGEEFGLESVGLGARDTLRLEMGYCLYGNELNEETNPIEAGLGWVTKLVEGKEFVGRTAIEKIKNEGAKRRLVGIELLERGIPRGGYPILNEAGVPIGEITSGTMSPSLGVGIGLGYVDRGFGGVGAALKIEVRGRALAAKIVKLPFYKE